MGDPRGFLRIKRKKELERAVPERILDSREVAIPLAPEELSAQASRCMDCGIPFCHSPVSTLSSEPKGGCPIQNLIPEWNDLVYRGLMDEAASRLHSTNNFPEVTSRVCPAPCEASCVLAIEAAPVSIKSVERGIAEHIFRDGPLTPVIAPERSGRSVAIIGSGPAGLACAQELARMGHDVTVFERDARLGGLLRYGIPDFKLSKEVLDIRIAQLASEGVRFQTSKEVGVSVTREHLQREFDAVVIAIGARTPRDLAIPGRQLRGIHFAMDYLTAANRHVSRESEQLEEEFDARGKHVIVIGGGDTGSDCVGTAVRQGAKSVTQLEVLPRPPEHRAPMNPWPDWPTVLRTSSSHAENAGAASARQWSVQSSRFRSESDGDRVKYLDAICLPPTGTEELSLDCDMALLAVGFLGPEKAGVIASFGLELTSRGNIQINADGSTSSPGVFAAGDASRGQSLVVWAIADGRRAARGVAEYLRRLPK